MYDRRTWFLLMLLLSLHRKLFASKTREKTTIIVNMIKSKVLNYCTLPLTYFYIIQSSSILTFAFTMVHPAESSISL